MIDQRWLILFPFMFAAGLIVGAFVSNHAARVRFRKGLKQIGESMSPPPPPPAPRKQTSQDEIMDFILDSHKTICEIKQMDEKEAYGHDPAVYYTLGVAGEAGEMANEIVKALRDGYNEERVKNAVKKELPDVIIYSYILAYVLDLDLTDLVKDKVQIVTQRAKDGYYGGPLIRRPSPV